MPEAARRPASLSHGASRQSAHEAGVLGEERAVAYLRSEGYEILARNFRTRAGEIDIIARKSGTIAFVEVKTWNALSEVDLEYSIDRRKRLRILGAARAFLARNPDLADTVLRFDVLLLDGSSPRAMHIEEAFSGGSD
jgi:putative endonuclease